MIRHHPDRFQLLVVQQVSLVDFTAWQGKPLQRFPCSGVVRSVPDM